MIDERRKYARILREEPIKVDVLCNEHFNSPLVFECSSKDFSAKGVRIHGQHPVPLNQDVEIVVHLGKEDKEFILSGKIMWTTETTENEHVAGIELSDNQETDIDNWRTLFST
ncbi:PilZ domain-containing protein [Aliikangiella sp. IMCC44359]|uniref:PilZ domain-containing protein n=1 Tax=Aliikangiella sp. IMCC44359 TaxID=3459125 RepID=UPI00403AE366